MAGAPAAAHGELVGTQPSPGERVGPVLHIDLVFSTEMFDWSLTVEGPDGEPLDGQAVQKAGQFLSYETTRTETEGQYIVRYSGIDDDGDLIEGAYAFIVEADGPAPAEMAVDLSVLDDDSLPWWNYALLMVGIVVIAVLAGLLAEKMRRLRALERTG